MSNCEKGTNPNCSCEGCRPDLYLVTGGAPGPRNKYQREIKPGVWVDVYDVLQAFNVTCPAMAHGIKKCLAPGQRGVKDSVQDKNEAIASIKRSIEMETINNG